MMTSQVGGGASIKRHLRFNNSRPVWSARLIREMSLRRRQGLTLSPPGYPHAAEDIESAFRAFVAPRWDGGQLAVFSSITPWVELTLRACLLLPSHDDDVGADGADDTDGAVVSPPFAGDTGRTRIVTVDYNPPLLSRRVRGLQVSATAGAPHACPDRSAHRARQCTARR